jgi:hypothetical protein
VDYLKQLFEGPYYFVGTLLFIGIVTGFWQVYAGARDSQLRRRQERALSAIDLMTWLQTDVYKCWARTNVSLKESGSADLRSLFARGSALSSLDASDVARSHNLDVTAMLDLVKGAGPSPLGEDARQIANYLEVFSAKVKRAPIDGEVAYLYCAPFFCAAVETWAPQLAFARDEDPLFFSDGLALYLDWHQRLVDDRRVKQTET